MMRSRRLPWLAFPVVGLALLVLAGFFLPFEVVNHRDYRPASSKTRWGEVTAKLAQLDIGGEDLSELHVWVHSRTPACTIDRIDVSLESAGAAPLHMTLSSDPPGFYFSGRIRRPYADHVVRISPAFGTACRAEESVVLLVPTHHWIEERSFFRALSRQ